MGPPLRRYQPNVAGEDLRRVMARDHEKYNNDNVSMLNVYLRYASESKLGQCIGEQFPGTLYMHDTFYYVIVLIVI